MVWDLHYLKSIISIQGWGEPQFLWRIEFHPVFPLSLAPPLLLAAYIFTAPTCKGTIISLQPCALKWRVSAFHSQI
jgi:hypothetical protein